MKYQGYLFNDFINGEGVCVSLWTQGCPHRCEGCHNQEMWDFDGGYEVPSDLKEQLKRAITANGITRNFSVLGGEPLCDENYSFVYNILAYIRENFPSIKIFLWTGYTLDELKKLKKCDILSLTDVLIDGRYEHDKRDISLHLRGSENQKIINTIGDKRERRFIYE